MNRKTIKGFKAVSWTYTVCMICFPITIKISASLILHIFILKYFPTRKMWTLFLFVNTVLSSLPNTLFLSEKKIKKEHYKELSSLTCHCHLLQCLNKQKCNLPFTISMDNFHEFYQLIQKNETQVYNLSIFQTSNHESLDFFIL